MAAAVKLAHSTVARGTASDRIRELLATKLKPRQVYEKLQEEGFTVGKCLVYSIKAKLKASAKAKELRELKKNVIISKNDITQLAKLIDTVGVQNLKVMVDLAYTLTVK
jgi:hypothetical protein